MGVISDAIDALEDWCCDLFKDGIKSQFDGISELLTDTFAQTTGSGAKGNLVSNFLTKHPAQFTGTAGSAPTGYGIWATIETLCNNVVVPIGGFILTVILLNELYQMDHQSLMRCNTCSQHILHRFRTIFVWHKCMLQRTCHAVRQR